MRREKNDLQDANTRLDVELKDVRGQLSDSTKENQRLRRGIFSKCAPCRQADIFHNRKRRRAPFSFSASSPRSSGTEYGQVELAAKYSQQDCKLDSLLDGIEEEYNQSE